VILIYQRLTFAKNFFQHSIKMPVNVVVDEANHAKSVSRQSLCSCRIVNHSFCMRIAVDLDDQTHFVTEKIRDERRPRVLPAEFESAELSVADALPEFLFGRRGFMAHFSCAFQQFGGK
jgi:hypothetical protein